MNRIYEFTEDQVEGIKVVLDAFAHGMEAGSDMLDWREQCAIRKVAHALGLDPDEFTPTPHRKVVGHQLVESKLRTGYVDKSAVYLDAIWPNPTEPLTDEPNWPDLEDKP